jgi:hypothetical protein
MNLNYKELLPAGFDASTRVWIYQCNRLFTLSEALEIETMLENFVAQWQTHGIPVKGFATLFFGQFIIIMADETAVGVSGCSTDSSVHVIKNIEQKYKVDMFNRQLLAFIVKDKIQLLPLAQLNHAIQHGFITPATLYFNNLVATKQALENNWIVPAKDTWLSKKFTVQNSTL